jgi:DNA-binding MarR family transcriptional regulator
VAKPDDVIKATATLDYRVLEFLHGNPGTLKSELAKQMKVQRNSVTATLNALLQQGDVVASKSGRTQSLTVSAQGAARIQAGPPHQGGIPF